MPGLRVIHFGTGGGSGVTRFLVDLAEGHAKSRRVEPLVVFRRKKHAVGENFLRDLAASGVPHREVRAWPKFLTISELRKIIREFRPDVLVAHGYSDHLWGRLAALRENVPVIVQVEHNLERYKWLHLWRSKRLAARTEAIVGVSQGVTTRLAASGHPKDKLRVILNGIRLERFSVSTPWLQRERAVLMTARFARQKDQATLIRAAGVLRDRGTPVKVRLVGGGKQSLFQAARRLTAELDLLEWVEFLGPRSDLPQLLGQHRVFALSTHFEGLPLALMEAMAAGCAAVGTRAPGVDELIEPGRTGWLSEPKDPVTLADAIAAALDDSAAPIAAASLRLAQEKFALRDTVAAYERMFEELLAAKRRR